LNLKLRLMSLNPLPFLVSINTTKNYHYVIANYCTMPISWLRSGTFDSLNFIPIVRSYKMNYSYIYSLYLQKLYW
jgi:hypothetical protein